MAVVAAGAPSMGAPDTMVPPEMVTDTAFYRYPHYHQSSDTPDRLRYPEMARVVEGLAAMMASLAGGS